MTHLAILDTSVILQDLINGSGYLKQIITFVASNKLALCTSPETYNELVATISQERVKKYLEPNQKQVSKFVAWYKYNTKMYKITDTHTLKRDPNDAIWLNLIDASHASYLVSNDKDLLELKSFQDCKIIKVRDFLNIILER